MKSNNTQKSRLVSGIMPVRKMHIGTLLGSVRQVVDLQSSKETFFLVADLHAITFPHAPRVLQKGKIQGIASLLAAGVDPSRTTIFIQSSVPAHSELCWILQCITEIGSTTFYTPIKEKIKLFTNLYQKNAKHAPTAILSYFLLQASDILLYGGVPPQPIYVSLGADQRNFLRFVQAISKHFNETYGYVFSEPENVNKESKAVPSLKRPEQKMFRAIGPKGSLVDSDNIIYIDDSEDSIVRKVRQATIDSLLILKQILLKLEVEGQNPVAGQNVEKLKQEVSDLLTETLRPIRNRYLSFLSDESYLREISTTGNERAREESTKVLDAVKNALGLSFAY